MSTSTLDHRVAHLRLAALLLEAACCHLTITPHPEAAMPITEAILAYLRRRARPQHYTVIAQHLDVSPVYVKHQLHKMVKHGRVRWVELGVYALPSEVQP
jgi:hypothetical protein